MVSHVEASALQHSGAGGLHSRSPLLRLQSDERLVAFVRRGNSHAFEALVARYQSRLLAFCRHMLASREDAEDVLQEVFAAAYNAMIADERPINVRPWLYRIARNRSLNHLRKAQAVGVDSMDVHLSEHGQTTADKVHKREEFRLLMADVQELPESQRTALLLREIDALAYEQIAEVMDTTVPSVKSLLVRARVGLAEASEARLLSCEEVRAELGEVAEGLKRTTAPARRHVRQCERCQIFKKQLRRTNTNLALMMPVGPLLLAKKLFLAHLGTTAAATGGGAAAAGTGAAAGVAGAGLAQAGLSAVATKAAAGLAAAAIVTAGAVEVKQVTGKSGQRAAPVQVAAAAPAVPVAVQSQPQPVQAVQKPLDARPKETEKKVVAKAAAVPTPEAVDEAEASKAPEADTIAADERTPGTTEHDGDTTTLPADYTAETQGSSGGTGSGGSTKTTQPDQSQSQSQPQPQSQETTAAEPAEAEPAPEESPGPIETLVETVTPPPAE